MEKFLLKPKAGQRRVAERLAVAAIIVSLLTSATAATIVSTSLPAAVDILPSHDVAITNVLSSKGFVYATVTSRPVMVNVTVADQGSVPETVTVTARANELTIGVQTVSLRNKESIVVTFNWDVSTLPVGNYQVSAEVTTIAGEKDVADNSLTGGFLQVRKTGDVDGDGDVDIDDLISVYLHQFTQSRVHDIDNDGDVDIDDLITTYLHQFR